MPPVFTVGHSTRSIDEFVTLLRAGRVETIVDVRTVPRSRTNPQYNLDALPDALADYQVGHCRIAALGGLRGRDRGVSPEVNAWWTNQSFHNYADHALSENFTAGLTELLNLACEKRTAIMCSEAVWWRCHRRIIADYLLARGRNVFHLMGKDRVDLAKMTPAAVQEGESLIYPPKSPA